MRLIGLCVPNHVDQSLLGIHAKCDTKKESNKHWVLFIVQANPNCFSYLASFNSQENFQVHLTIEETVRKPLVCLRVQRQTKLDILTPLCLGPNPVFFLPESIAHLLSFLNVLLFPSVVFFSREASCFSLTYLIFSFYRPWFGYLVSEDPDFISQLLLRFISC